MTTSFQNYRLGLDIGTSSIGWALCPVDYTIDSENIDISCGVRIFPEGVEREKNKITEIPRSQNRREKRLLRRQHARKCIRRDLLVKTLRDNNCLPSDKQEYETLLRSDPYPLRKKGLDERLSRHELGRVLLHINKRRGFKSNRKTPQTKDDGKVAKETAELNEQIQKAGARTLGEYLAGLNPQKIPVRGRYTLRSMFKNEYDLIIERQLVFYPELQNLRVKLKNLIFSQRPVQVSKNMIGDCRLEPGEKKCPLADWHAQQFRLLQEVNNLRILSSAGNERSLTADEQTSLVNALSSKKEVTIERLHSILSLADRDTLSIETGKRKKIKGNEIEFMLSKHLKKTWKEASPEMKEKINQALIDIEDPDKLRQTAETEWNYSGSLDFEIPAGYIGFSHKALLKLLPFMQEGLNVTDAISKAGYSSRADNVTASDILPLPDVKNINNPIVRRALFEVRKVVNALTRKYGKPAEIMIELAREARGNKEKREDYLWTIEENRKKREDAKEAIEEYNNITQPSREDTEKYLLWKEIKEHCPYCPKMIPPDRLFSADVEVDHILPRSRSLDNSYMNKTICHTKCNKDKGNRLPYEAFAHDESVFQEILSRVACLPYAKRKRFSQKNIELDEVVKRELNDTRYINRVVRDFVGQLGVSVAVSRGGITAQLRGLWGLNKILSDSSKKARDDHRNHAVDAIVLALTTSKLLFWLSNEFASMNKPRTPWKTLWTDAERAVKKIVVAHRIQRKVSGGLHMETCYGVADEKKQEYVVRKKTKELTGSMVAKIRDNAIRSLVETRCREKGIDPKKVGSKQLPKEVFAESLFMPNGPEIKKVRIIQRIGHPVAIKAGTDGHVRIYESEHNHHMEIFEITEKGKTKRDYAVVTLMEAAERLRNKLPIVKRDHGPDKKFIMSLSINEMVQMDEGPQAGKILRVQKIDQNGLIVLREHIDALSGQSNEIRLIANTLKAHKISISPIGEIYLAND